MNDITGNIICDIISNLIRSFLSNLICYLISNLASNSSRNGFNYMFDVVLGRVGFDGFISFVRKSLE